MRANTQIHIALRNIGDSQDTGQFFEGTLSESMLWLATKMSKVSMATRIVVGMGRNKDDAARGIDVKGAGQQALNDDMKALLESVFADEQDEFEPAKGRLESTSLTPPKPAKKLEGDDYES